MRIILMLLFLFTGCLSCVAQKPEILKDIEFDSSYCVIGIGQGFQGKYDSLPRFWFILNNPRDMETLRKDWVLKKGSISGFEKNSIDVFVTKDNQRVNGGALIYPLQGRINVLDNWYKFDTAKLTKLHNQHPLKYHTEVKVFDTYPHYIGYANSIVHDSLLLFFFEPTLTYEGRFTITVKEANTSDNSIFVSKDINEELKALGPNEQFQASPILNDSFTLSHPDKVRITVECSKSLYAKYKNNSYEVGEWQPALIQTKVFWKD